MSDPVLALKRPEYQGFVKITEVGPLGMITLRATPGIKGLAAAVKAAVGLALPAERRIVTDGDRAAGWMSSDEYLLILPYAEVGKTLETLTKKLKDAHHLAVDVSDARAVFRIDGAKADQVLRKLCPADLDRMEPDELRRTRAAQVAVAFWRQGDGFTLVSFRSVACYVMGLLTHSAQPGSELN
jgi:sarcosine oxidase, subunit gamma